MSSLKKVIFLLTQICILLNSVTFASSKKKTTYTLSYFQINCNFSLHQSDTLESSTTTTISSTTSSSSSSSSSPHSDNSSALHFLYHPAHSPPSVSIWGQVVILHSLALIFAVAFYALHRVLVYRLANVKAPPMTAERRYTVPRTPRPTTTTTSAAAAAASSSIVPTPAPKQQHKAATSSSAAAVPSTAKKNSTSKAAPELKQRGGGHPASKVKK